MYTIDTYKQPFWAENSGFMTGRDPLGIQNSSITVYAALLPGMTNLTLRLRYYGLYCWLLVEYDKIAGEPGIKNLEHQYNFIRRAELTIAFIMQKLDSTITSIVGSDYASNHIHEFDDIGYFRISKGADKTKDTVKGSVYWDYTSGALGQYYAGSLISQDLIETNNKFFLIREKGKELASAFENSITPNARQVFLNVVKDGVLYHNDMNNLKEFRINGIVKDSQEWHFYSNLLLQNDGYKSKTSDNKFPSNRKNTIKLYLEFLTASLQDYSFPKYQYQLVESNNYSYETSFGWYYYFLNEAIHYCIETVFWAMLVELDGKNVPIHKFINEIVDIILEQHKKKLSLKEDQTLLDAITSMKPADLYEELNRLESLTKSTHESKQAMGFALLTFIQIYMHAESKREKIVAFENLYYLHYQKGIVSEFIKIFIDDLLEIQYQQYIERIIKIIINDHISTAYRKMGNGESNLLKFVIEDGIIGHIQTMSPKYTNPRIQTLHNILGDLGYIDSKGKITSSGKEILKEIS